MTEGKWHVYRCGCMTCAAIGRTSWVAVSPYLEHTFWSTWRRAMLRATKGY